MATARTATCGSAGSSLYCEHCQKIVTPELATPTTDKDPKDAPYDIRYHHVSGSLHSLVLQAVIFWSVCALAVYLIWLASGSLTLAATIVGVMIVINVIMAWMFN